MYEVIPVWERVILCPYMQVHIVACCILGSNVSLRSHRRASRHLVWPVWSSTASAKRRYLTSQTSCSSSRMWNPGRLAGCGSVHCFIFKQKKKQQPQCALNRRNLTFPNYYYKVGFVELFAINVACSVHVLLLRNGL